MPAILWEMHLLDKAARNLLFMNSWGRNAQHFHEIFIQGRCSAFRNVNFFGTDLNNTFFLLFTTIYASFFPLCGGGIFHWVGFIVTHRPLQIFRQSYERLEANLTSSLLVVVKQADPRYSDQQLRRAERGKM